MNLSSYMDLAVRLANTAAQASGEPDPLSSPAACKRTLGDCLEGPVTRRDLDVLRHVRQEFHAIFTAAATGDDQQAMARLNALLVQFPVQPEMTDHDDQRWHVHLASQGAIGERFAAAAIISVALTVSMAGVSRLGICAIASCDQVFIDASRGRSRRYCVEHAAAARGNVSTLRRAGAGRPPAASADKPSADPHRPDPRSAEPHRAEPHRAEPHRADPRSADPHRADPHRADPGSSQAQRASQAS